MGWGIKKEEFEAIEEPPPLSSADRADGFIGTVLFYGFGDDGQGHSDPVLSGKLAWDYALRNPWRKTWQCRYVQFDRPEFFRLRPGAPPRPKGFYYAKLQPGEKFRQWSVSRLRRVLKQDTGCGPEGFQLLAVTHTHLADMMNKGQIPFMALADYDIAPYGFNDFFDAPQLFCSQDVLGLGMGNVDGDYPKFGIPTIRFY